MPAAPLRPAHHPHGSPHRQQRRGPLLHRLRPPDPCHGRTAESCASSPAAAATPDRHAARQQRRRHQNHCSAIFSKMGVRVRTQAVLRQSDLGVDLRPCLTAPAPSRSGWARRTRRVGGAEPVQRNSAGTCPCPRLSQAKLGEGGPHQVLTGARGWRSRRQGPRQGLGPPARFSPATCMRPDSRRRRTQRVDPADVVNAVARGELLGVAQGRGPPAAGWPGAPEAAAKPRSPQRWACWRSR